MSHRICNIHKATSRLLIQRLLAWLMSTCDWYSSRGCRCLPRHTIMCNSLSSTWKSRSDSGEHWKGGAPFLGALEGGAPFFIPSVFSQHQIFRVWNNRLLGDPLWKIPCWPLRWIPIRTMYIRFSILFIWHFLTHLWHCETDLVDDYPPESLSFSL